MWREEHKHLGREPQFCLPLCPLLRLLSLLIHPGDSFPSRPGLGLGPQSQGPRSLVPFPQYPNCVTLWDSVSNVIIKAVFGMASWGQCWPLGMVFAELPPGLAQHRGFTLQHGGVLGLPFRSHMIWPHLAFLVNSPSLSLPRPPTGS